MALIAALLIGYSVGKYVGHVQGINEGKTAAIMVMRQKSFEQGYCSLCKSSLVEDSGITSSLSTYTNEMGGEDSVVSNRSKKRTY